MSEKNKVYALIFAGGRGKRMSDTDIPKQFMEVDGKTIIIRTLEHFSAHEEVDGIVIVCLESWIDELQRQIAEYGIHKVEWIIPGGETGFQSIHLGIEKLAESADPQDIVMLCDGVRPMLNKKLLSDCIAFSKEYGSAVPVTPSIDSILYSVDGKSSSQHYDRNEIFITQAPQGYRLSRIREAHKTAVERGMEAISSADLLIALKQEVHLFPGIRENIKVTTPEDLKTLRASYYYEHFKHFAKEEMNGNGKQ